MDNHILLVDFEKAFDRVSWSFLFFILEEFDFPPIFITILRNVHFDSCTFVKTNGYLSNVSRDVRQGDPLSPILFILSIEIVCTYIYQVAGHIPSTYCDDSTAVTNGTKQSAEVIEWLDDFGKKYSGMTVNFDKTILMYRGGDRP
eukprot:Awhi_evm1s1044